MKNKELEPIIKELRNIFSLRPSEAIFITAIATVLFTITGIWQLVVISGFVGGFFAKRGKVGFAIGFLGVFFGWMALFIYYALTTEMIKFFEFWLEETMGVGIEWMVVLMVISSLLGGFIGGLGGVNGAFISRILIEKISKSSRF